MNNHKITPATNMTRIHMQIIANCEAATRDDPPAYLSAPAMNTLAQATAVTGLNASEFRLALLDAHGLEIQIGGEYFYPEETVEDIAASPI